MKPRASQWMRRTNWLQSLRTRLILWNTLSLTLLLAVLGLAMRLTVQQFMLASVDRELEQRTRRRLGPPPDGSPDGPPPPPPTEMRSPSPDPRPPEGSRPPSPDPRQPERPHPPSPDHDPPSNSPILPIGPIGFGGPGMGFGPGGPLGQGFGRRFRMGDHMPIFFDTAGHPLDDTERTAPWDLNELKSSLNGEPRRTTIEINNEQMRILTWPVQYRGKTEAVLQSAYNLQDVNRALAGLNSALLTLIPLGLISAGLTGAALTGRVLKRVEEMTATMSAMGAADVTQRLPIVGGDEFSRLASTFNGLLTRLESAFERQERLLEQQRRFTADASHELKTPLTIIKGNTSLSLEGVADPESQREALIEIDQAANTMSQLVQDLLLLARQEESVPNSQRIELLLHEVLERAISSVPNHLGAVIRLQEADPEIKITGNEQELTRVFINLLDNARRFTPAEGQITVETTWQDNQAVITVVDTGCGIEAQHLTHLGERFYRVDASRARPSGGSGLGLSICKGILQKHQGSLQITSQPGVGTQARVMLPANIEI